MVAIVLLWQPLSAKSLKLAVSILPQADIVRNIVQDGADIMVLVPPGASPETYEPTPAQLKELASVSAYIKIGTHFEFEENLLKRIVKLYPSLAIVNCASGIDLINVNTDKNADQNTLPGIHAHGEDPHIWYSLRNARKIIGNIAEGLAAINPADGAVYRKNAAVYIARVDSLDFHLTAILSPFKGSKFIVFHPAWGYFARDYGLVQIAVESHGKEPSASQMIQLIRMAKAEDLKTIFVSPQFDREKAMTIAKEIGGTVEIADPLPSDFLAGLRHFGERLALSYER